MFHVLRKESAHRRYDDLEFWAEDGLIYIEDHRDGDFNVVTCDKFAQRAEAFNKEAKEATYQADKDKLNSLVLMMYETWKEAKAQGDPSDPAVAIQKHRERRKRAVLITG